MMRILRQPAAVLLMTAFLGTGCTSISALWSGDDVVAAKPTAVPGGQLHIAWQHDVDQRKPASPPGFSLPVVVAAKSGELIVAGGQDARLRVYDATGKERLRVALDAAGESGGLVLANGLVVVGDVGGNLYGLDLLNGTVKWRYTLGSALIGKPVAAGDGFIIQASNNQLYRFNEKGEKQWSYSGQLGGLAMHLTPSPRVYHDRVYAALSNGDIVALKASDGGLLWKHQTIFTHDAAVLSELKVPLATPVVIPAALSGADEDMLAVAIFQGELSFLSLSDGTMLKTRLLSVKSSPVLIGDKLYVADTQGYVSALDAAHGDTLWKKQISDGELVGPVLVAGKMWLADDHGRVYRMDQSGHVDGRITLGGRIDRLPVVAEAGVLVRNHLGVLYLLR